jgi:hypothetical protein
MTITSTRLIRAAGATALLALVAACGPAEYQRAAEPGDVGYRTTQLAEDRFLVSFQGDPATSRQTVETYLLYRAAEVADRQGHPYFVIVNRETDRDVDVRSYYTAPGFYGYGPGLGIGSRYAFPYYGTWPPVSGPQPRTVDTYEASATVEMLESRPADRQGVFETEQVLTTLRDEVAPS